MSTLPFHPNSTIQPDFCKTRGYCTIYLEAQDTMDQPNKFWLDGEKIPGSTLKNIFRPVPGVPEVFSRSSLITGGRGVGKTTLLSYQKQLHDGNTVFIDLHDIFSSISLHTGHGSLALASDYPASLYAQISNKAQALLAVEITKQLLPHTSGLSPSLLRACLPASIRVTILTQDWLLAAQKEIDALPLSAFESRTAHSYLMELLDELYNSIPTLGKPILLLFDRADMVPTPCLVPVFQLLDQTGKYILLVAMRPTHGPEQQPGVIPDDQFDIVHIGTYPRSAAWTKFVSDSVRAQMEALDHHLEFDQIPDHSKSRIITIARDSVRDSLQLFIAALTNPKSFDYAPMIDYLRAKLLTSARSVLQRYHSDFPHLIRDIRNHGLRTGGVISSPIIINIIPKQSDLLFDGTSDLQRFVSAALRCNGLCMPPGQPWAPNGNPLSLECPPLLMWDSHDPAWTWEDCKEIHITLKEGELFAGGGGFVKQPSVFVAYRMRSEESANFRRDIEAEIRGTPRLTGVQVLDGHVYGGTEWATEIRKRLSSSRLVLADVTGMRPDIMFELGFARGLNKPIVPISMAKNGAVGRLSPWLTSIQVISLKNKDAMRNIVGSILGHLSDHEINVRSRLPGPVVGKAIWLRKLSWNAAICSKFVTLCTNSALLHEVLVDDMEEGKLVKEASRANLLVACLDGSMKDSLVHFVCGAIAAKPKPSGSLTRRILLVTDPRKANRELVADSLRKCHDAVTIVTPAQVIDQVTLFQRDYSKWTQSAMKAKRKRS